SQAGRMNRRIRYSRFSSVLMPTSWSGSHRSIHTLTVIFPAFGSVQRPSRILASWSRPQAGAAAFVSNPDSLLSVPLGSLYFSPPPATASGPSRASPRRPLDSPTVRSGLTRADRLPRSGSHGLGDVVIAEPQMLAHERARN